MPEEIAMESTDTGLEQTNTPETEGNIGLTEGIQEPAGELFTVKVDGDEMQVSLEELQSGYQRQSDYTRKTQDIAAERERLQQAEAIVSALEADPQGTLQALHNAFGVEETVPSNEPIGSDWEADDPQSERINRLEKQLESQAKIQRQHALDKEMSALKEQHGEFDEQELFQHALKNQIPNLEAAFAHMKFNEVAEKAKRLEEEAAVVEAKREAAVVETGSSRQAGAIVASSNSSEAPSSIREAFLQAKAALGS